MRIVMLGPPGAGKGTQAAELAREIFVPHISTGDIFRAAIKEETPLGLRAKQFMDKGNLVPDDLTVEIVRDRLSAKDCEVGYVLDGFPRTLVQAEMLDRILCDMGTPLDIVVEIAVSPQELLRRLVNRRSCPDCGKIYHLLHSPPKEEGVCDVCRVGLIHRSDDKPEVIENRIRVYDEKTGPLGEYYRGKGILVSVRGERAPKEVLEEILEKLGIKSKKQLT